MEGFFWPKIFWDFLTKTLDPAVKPVPVLQIFNLLFGIIGLCWEWPLGLVSGTMLHRSIEARLVVYPLFALASILLYQATNAGLYYLIGLGVYFWAFAEGEVSLNSTTSLLPMSNSSLDCLPCTLDTTKAKSTSKGLNTTLHGDGVLR
jgi:hypothetical protein